MTPKSQSDKNCDDSDWYTDQSRKVSIIIEMIKYEFVMQWIVISDSSTLLLPDSTYRDLSQGFKKKLENYLYTSLGRERKREHKKSKPYKSENGTGIISDFFLYWKRNGH